ncbi:sucrase-isomaltase, intestinal [Triplophysa rosa]|uniref:sucrase-isomaltase, intestinal n=1 Tax=Triplophysa rosa TaxID=992332 RepID=UPI002546204D|nr:sucrase-isomaltase, intestinal [Triplophysa rosa]
MGKRRFSGLEVTLMVMFTLVLAVAVALVIFLALGEPAVIKEESGSNPDPIVPECPNIPQGERVDCFPDAGASQQKCLARGCCWRPLDEANIPWCFFSKNHGYTVVSEHKPDSTHIEARLQRMNAPSLFGADIEELTFQAEMQTENRLRFKITDAKQSRFEVPHEHVKPPSGPPTRPLNYELELIQKPFGLRVWRTSPRKVVFDTTIGPLVFADQYLQLSAKLPSHNIYGLGEHVHQNFRHDTNWRTWPLFTRDAFPNGGTHNLYGHYPYFTCLEDESGKSLGVFLMNSNAMEVTLQPAPAVTFRTIGGVLDFYILVGDTPEAVVDEFTKLIGRPFIPPYWSLGFQLSRWDYGSLEEVKRTVERNRQVGLPYDVQYTDIDYMEEKKIFTYDTVKFKELPQFADYMHEKGQKYIIILDPAVATSPRVNGPYETLIRGNEAKVWVTEADGVTPLVGEVWPGETVFPDYTNQACIDWWVDEIARFHKEVKHDALWIDMNEIASFVKGSNKGCADNNLNYPPYTPRILDEVLYSKTLCMDAKQKWGNHYDVHSLYGYSMVLATEQASRQVFGNNRSMVFTRSSFPGVGKYAGHWLGDNAANWNDIKWAIPGMLEFNLFGIPYIGADICGFFDDCPEELCRRWMQVGAFYPFSRNHNAQYYKPQDPASYGADSLLVKTSKHYLNIRYSLLPYLYTLFFDAHVNGGTVVRPVMHEFFSDSATWTVDRQFLWGAHLLITPVLDPGVDRVRAYIPDAIWYDFETETKITERKQLVDMYLPADKLGLHLRGGAILPVQRPDVTTTYSRLHPMGLIIALDENSRASGELFWDDGESRDTVSSGSYIHCRFSVVNGVLSINVFHDGYTDPNNLQFENITVMGISGSPAAVLVTEGSTSTVLTESQIHYDPVKEVMHLRDLKLDLGKNYTVTWEVKDSGRFDCYPEEDSNEANCKQRGCIWKPSDIPKEPWCFYPAAYGYKASNLVDTSSGWTLDLDRINDFPSSRSSSPDINKLRVEITYLSGHSLRWKIFDPVNKRFEVPVPLTLPSTPETNEAKRLYRVQISGDLPFGIQVIRKSTNETIWDSALPGFTFSELFLQISTRLPSNYIYGFGETEHGTYKHDLNFHTYGLFAKDQPPGEFGTLRSDRGQPAACREPGPSSRFPSLGTDRPNGPGLRTANRPAQASPPPEWREVEHEKGAEREWTHGRPGIPGAEHDTRSCSPRAGETVVEAALMRRRAVALDPLGRSLGKPSDELLQHHAVDDVLDVTVPSQQPFAAGIPELVGHPEGTAAFAQPQHPESLTMLLWATADPLEDGPLQVVEDQERQDPVAWGEAFASMSRDVLIVRYTLLPYLYTLMYEAHAHGNTVVRPMLHEFVTDETTWSIDKQFLWGPALLITPVLDPGATMVRGYVPNARWYDYHTGEAVGVRGQFLNMEAPMDKINLHVRGGHILPWQKAENNTRNSRVNPLGLIVALNDDGSAHGSLFWDDGEGIDTVKTGQFLLTSFTASESALSSRVDANGLAPADRLTLGVVKVWGSGTVPITQVTMSVDGNPNVDLVFKHDPATEVLEFDVTSQHHTLDKTFSISWKTT